MPADNRNAARVEALMADVTVIPVVTIEDAAAAPDLARALCAGGCRIIEVTLRTPAAAEAARAIVKHVPEAMVAIGTVLTVADYDLAASLGASLAISPGQSSELLAAGSNGILPYLPGVQTASDILACVNSGYGLVKFFPAAQAGGMKMLDALGGPFPRMRFCPTGGIDGTTAPVWLSHPKVAAIGGSWIAPNSDIEAANWTAISDRARLASSMRGSACS